MDHLFGVGKSVFHQEISIMSLILFFPGGLSPTVSLTHVFSLSLPARLQVLDSRDHALGFLSALHRSKHVVITGQLLMVSFAVHVVLRG